MIPARNRRVTKPDNSDLSGFRTLTLSELLSSPQPHLEPPQDIGCRTVEPQHLVVDPRGFEPLTF